MEVDKRAESLKKARAKRLENLAARRAAAPVDPPPMPTKPPPAPVKQAAASWPVNPGELLGITNEDCCIDCTMERCVITGKAYCGHPKKCGLQAMDKVDPTVMERFNKARKALLHAEVDRQT